MRPYPFRWIRKSHLYYIAQEALNNVLKHAKAKSVTVRLKQTKSNVKLEVEDDGNGFTPGKDNCGGMGMRNMKERASQVGGKISHFVHTRKGDQNMRNSQQGPAIKNSPVRSADMKKIKVLVVEDQTVVREGIVAILSFQPDIEVVGEAHDGFEGLQLAQLKTA